MMQQPSFYCSAILAKADLKGLADGSASRAYAPLPAARLACIEQRKSRGQIGRRHRITELARAIEAESGEFVRSIVVIDHRVASLRSSPAPGSI
jgi:hypothetical protein